MDAITCYYFYGFSEFEAHRPMGKYSPFRLEPAFSSVFSALSLVFKVNIPEKNHKLVERSFYPQKKPKIFRL